MSVVKYLIFLSVIIWLGIVVLMPKQALYYALEERLSSEDIVLNEKGIEEGFFGLTLKDVSVYAKGIHVATIQEIDLFTLLFYSSIEIKALRMDDSLKTMVPQETNSASLKHFLYDPLLVSVEAIGTFGSVVGEINFNERNVHLDFNESKNIEMLRPQLEKGDKGWVYETSF
ncbi:MAG: hypothetical protein U9O64_01925 [Campylobacterota bacterium]|nr:hypothetical protein [Campylobacterota bacterium]